MYALEKRSNQNMKAKYLKSKRLILCWRKNNNKEFLLLFGFIFKQGNTGKTAVKEDWSWYKRSNILDHKKNLSFNEISKNPQTYPGAKQEYTKSEQDP